MQVSCWKPVQIRVGPEEGAVNSVGQNYRGVGCLVRKGFIVVGLEHS